MQEFESATTSTDGMSIDDFESLALANNPAIRELAASIQKVAGFRTQVGLRANPMVGYQGMQLADKGTDQHTAFIEQQFITGGKLALNQRVLSETLRAQLWELEAQKYRIQTDIRVKFYDVYSAQERIKLITQFQEVAAKGLEVAELRNQAKEGSLVEVLQARIQLHGIELARQQAEITFSAAWTELAALTGIPQLPRTQLVGSLDTSVTQIDWENTRVCLLQESPEFKAASTRVQRARANIERQNVQAIPNVTAQLAAGVDYGTNSSLMNLQIGAPIPVHNKNQGNIAAAQADLIRALAEVQRIENSIQSRLAAVSRDYDSARAAVSKYANDILPSARQTLDMAEAAYRAGEFSFVEVLTVRRTFFESNLQFLLAQTQLAQADAKVAGFVLTGGLDATTDLSGDDSLRGLTLSQQ
jgi:cobalt-zinc-cadmium efflux system outer membrane protein